MTEEHNREVAVYQPQQAVSVFGTDDPAAIMERVVAIATPLARFVREKGMVRVLESERGRRQREERGDPPREYVQIEGWSFMGAMLGIAPVTREVRELRSPEGDVYAFEARVELVQHGQVVGGGIGECSWSESSWGNRDAYALKSMAQTRATGKAYRLSLGFVMAAAGFEGTPAEEMVLDHDGPASGAQPQRGRQLPREGGNASDLAPATADGIPSGLQNVGQLLEWALKHPEIKMRRADVVEALGYVQATEITDYDAAARRLWALKHPTADVEAKPDPAAEEPAETVDDVIRWAEREHGLSIAQLTALLEKAPGPLPDPMTPDFLRWVVESAIGQPPLEGEVV